MEPELRLSLHRASKMSTIANCPNVSNNSSGPSPGTIVYQGRRPALIPYSADLTAYISATSSSHASFHISPFGTILGATFSPPLSSSIGKAPLFVLPPSLPDGGCPNTLKPAWRGRGGTGDFSPFGWLSEEEDLDEGSEIVHKGGRKRAKTTSSSGRKARFRRSLSLGPVDINVGKVDIDVMDVDDEDEERKEVEGDVFSWVNSSSPIDDFPSIPLPNLASLTQTNHSHSSSKTHLQLNRPRKLNLNGEDDSPRTWSVPTSPTSGTFGPDLELQRRRLEEAGLGIESAVGFQGGGVEDVERKA